jgi:hypothetical protein
LTEAKDLRSFWSLLSVYGNAFETRYYAPWLACTVWFAWFVAAAHGERPRPVGLAISAVLICCVYLLGIVTWGLVALATLAAPHGLFVQLASWRRRS